MIRIWRTKPLWFQALALFAGITALLMSCVPTLVYIGMAPVIRSPTVVDSFTQRGFPILAFYGLAAIAATFLGPNKRPLLAATLLGVTLPASFLLMLYGLR